MFQLMETGGDKNHICIIGEMG